MKPSLPLFLALLALAGCPTVKRDPVVTRPPSGCTDGETTCRGGAPWRCNDRQWSQADRQCNRLADAGAVVCCPTPSALRPGVNVHACVPVDLCAAEVGAR